MKCPKCGRMIPDQAKFCPYCRIKLEMQQSQNNNSNINQINQNNQNITRNQRPVSNPVSNADNNIPPKKKSIAIPILIAVVAVIIVGWCVTMFILKPWDKHKKTDTETTTESMEITKDSENTENSDNTNKNSEDASVSNTPANNLGYDNNVSVRIANRSNIIRKPSTNDKGEFFNELKLGENRDDAYETIFNDKPETAYKIGEYDLVENFITDTKIKDIKDLDLKDIDLQDSMLNFYDSDEAERIQDEAKKVQAVEYIYTDANGKIVEYAYSLAVPNYDTGKKISKSVAKYFAGDDNVTPYENENKTLFVSTGKCNKNNGYIISGCQKYTIYKPSDDIDNFIAINNENSSEDPYIATFVILNEGGYNDFTKNVLRLNTEETTNKNTENSEAESNTEKSSEDK